MPQTQTDRHQCCLLNIVTGTPPFLHGDAPTIGACHGQNRPRPSPVSQLVLLVHSVNIPTKDWSYLLCDYLTVAAVLTQSIVVSQCGWCGGDEKSI